ncbi:MAG: uroporphyrinogen-III synthase [Ignavibacteria bacterium]|nr:uroporphyrinogen-III synthase [Ignavibacteria bacterium]
MSGEREQGLRGRRIMITRPAGQSSALADEILERGGEPLLFPVIAIEPPESWSRCDDLLKTIATYDAIAITSTNAVEGLFQRGTHLGLGRDDWQAVHWYAVGDTTATALKNRGIETVTGEEATADGLARFLTKTDLNGQRFLLPVGNRSRGILSEVLAQHGAVVDTVPVYRTVDTTPPTVNRVQRLFAENAIDVVTFASPSAVRRFLQLIDRRNSFGEDKRAVIAVIGPTTAEAVTSEGLLPAIIASHSSAEGLAAAIEQYYQKTR